MKTGKVFAFRKRDGIGAVIYYCEGCARERGLYCPEHDRPLDLVEIRGYQGYACVDCLELHETMERGRPAQLSGTASPLQRLVAHSH